jgi:hypothetical protein
MNMQMIPNPYNPSAYTRFLPSAPKVDNKTGRVIVYAVGGSIAAYLLYRLYLNIRAKEAQKTAYDPDKPESYAQIIRMALENNNWMGWGTDNAAIRQTLLSIPSKDFMGRVVKAYANLYKGASMMADMKSDLKTGEYNEMLAIIGGKPQSGNTIGEMQLTQQQYESWVRRIKAAFSDKYLIIVDCTDHEALMQVLKEVPTKAALEELKKVYRKLEGLDLDKQLKEKVSLYYSSSVKEIINSKQ